MLTLPEVFMFCPWNFGRGEVSEGLMWSYSGGHLCEFVQCIPKLFFSHISVSSIQRRSEFHQANQSNPPSNRVLEFKRQRVPAFPLPVHPYFEQFWNPLEKSVLRIFVSLKTSNVGLQKHSALTQLLNMSKRMDPLILGLHKHCALVRWFPCSPRHTRASSHGASKGNK